MNRALFTDNKFFILVIIMGIFLQSSMYIERTSSYKISSDSAMVFQNIPDIDAIYSPKKIVTVDQVRRILYTYVKHARNPIGHLYQETLTQGIVKDFLIKKAGSAKIVETILFYAEKENIPIETVFSLVFVESKFAPHVVNTNATSKDFGLFQLNSKTFRQLPLNVLMQIDTNVKMGVGYLKYAFSLDPDPRIALAIYNAGPSRPLRGMTPESTKKYVKKILAQERRLTKEFIKYVSKRFSLENMIGI